MAKKTYMTPLSVSDGSSISIDQEEADLEAVSLADVERRKAHPLFWTVYIVLVLAALIVPYWLGRSLAVSQTQWVISKLNGFEPQGLALVGWASLVVTCTGLGLMVVDSKRFVWKFVFVVGLAFEQLLAGVCLLNFNFWYATFVVYGSFSNLANAFNLGIIAAGLAVAVFAVLFVGLLVVIKKDSPLNVLTRSWASFLMFYVVEAIAIGIVIFTLMS